MGVMTTLQQDAVRRKEKSMEDMKKEIKKLNRKLEEKENQKQFEKDLKIALKNDLYWFFYSHFENMLDDNYTIEHIYNNLLLLKNKNMIINEKAQNSYERDYLNEIYKKTLNQIYEIYKDDLQAQKNLQPKLNQESIMKKIQNTSTPLDNEFSELTKKHNNTNISKKDINKNGFIAFLNMILKK